MPVLEVRNDNVPISEGQTVTITAGNASSSPQMPALTARLVGPSVTGNTTWRMETVYTDHARSDADAFPSAPRVLPSTSVWDIRSDTGGTIRGGTATVRYTYNNRPELTFSFQIRGTNASEADARARLGASPWFLTRIARQESGIRQFDSGGAPVFGSPNGWGLMQLDPPPGSSEIWSWWANVDAGKAVVNQKNAELTPTWNTRVSEWNSWNQAHPNQQVPAPSPRQEANCEFSWVGGGSGTEATKSFRDACWIKRYNGASGGDYLIWDDFTDPNNPTWAFRPINHLGENYVNLVCSRLP